jgi:hypothetical protein
VLCTVPVLDPPQTRFALGRCGYRRATITPTWCDVSKGHSMTLLIILLILALIFGGIGLLVEAAAWALIIAVVLLIAGVIAGFVGRGRTAA